MVHALQDGAAGSGVDLAITAPYADTTSAPFGAVQNSRQAPAIERQAGAAVRVHGGRGDATRAHPALVLDGGEAGVGAAGPGEQLLGRLPRRQQPPRIPPQLPRQLLLPPAPTALPHATQYRTHGAEA